MLLRNAAAGAVPFLLAGCVSMHSIRTEDEYSAARDIPAACGYAWETGDVLFRAEYVVSYRWGEPAAFGYGLRLHVAELPAKCPEPRVPGAPAAKVSAHFIEYGNKVYGWVTVLPLAFYVGLTVGFGPFPSFRSYAVCVQVTGDGLDRSAIAEGSISSLENVWGGSDTKQRQGRQETLARRSLVMKDLATQAWHKLWLAPAADPGGKSCSERLDAIAG